MSFPGVEVTYNAPDTVEQVEKGGESTQSGSSTICLAPGPSSCATAIGASNGTDTTVTQATSPEVITKIFIGNRYYEADYPRGQAPQFSVASRSPCNTDNAASAVLSLLRTIAKSATATKTANGYHFEVPAENLGNVLAPNSGNVIVQDGYVLTVDFVQGSSVDWTITAINHAPPVTAPSSAASMNESCGSGSATSPTTSAP